MMNTLTLDISHALIGASLDWANMNNENIAVAVVDSAGELIAFSRADGASPQSCVLAQNKAYTSARDRQKTSQLAAWAKETHKTLGFWTDPRITGMAGGVPIESASGQVIGGIGISGMAEEADDRLAMDVIAAVIKDRTE